MKVCSRCNISKEATEFRKRSAVSHGLTAWCKQCFSEYDRERYKNSDKERQRKKRNQKLVIEKSRNYIWEYLSNNPCIQCGESDPVVLEFDHVDRNTKVNNVSELLKFSIEKVKKEIEKCQVLCANCHRRKTAKQFNTWKFEKSRDIA